MKDQKQKKNYWDIKVHSLRIRRYPVSPWTMHNSRKSYARLSIATPCFWNSREIVALPYISRKTFIWPHKTADQNNSRQTTAQENSALGNRERETVLLKMAEQISGLLPSLHSSHSKTEGNAAPINLNPDTHKVDNLCLWRNSRYDYQKR